MKIKGKLVEAAGVEPFCRSAHLAVVSQHTAKKAKCSKFNSGAKNPFLQLKSTYRGTRNHAYYGHRANPRAALRSPPVHGRPAISR
jgi:hypothetical protein